MMQKHGGVPNHLKLSLSFDYNLYLKRYPYRAEITFSVFRSLCLYLLERVSLLDSLIWDNINLWCHSNTKLMLTESVQSPCVIPFCRTCVSGAIEAYRDPSVHPFVRSSIINIWCLYERNSAYSFWPIILKLQRCFNHGV